MERLLHDVRMALRTVLKNPAFSITVILCIALGIGANTSIFAVVSEVLLKPLPFPHSDRLVDIREMKAHRFPVRVAEVRVNFYGIHSSRSSLCSADAG